MALQHGRRKWVKLWVSEWLDGTMRFQMTPAQRGIWADLLALAGSSRTAGIIGPGETGGIADGFPLDYLASILRVDLETLKDALAAFRQQQRIDVNERGAIAIVNWAKYQSEYQRQAKYRRNDFSTLPDAPKAQRTKPQFVGGDAPPIETFNIISEGEQKETRSKK